MENIENKVLEELVGLEKTNIFKKLINEINSIYDNMHTTWNNGGKKWNYEYKFRKSNKTLCAIYFKKDVMGFMIIFGKEEQRKVDRIRNELSEKVLNEYDNAETFHDGKWVMFELNDYKKFDDLKKLLYIKRKPNIK